MTGDVRPDADQSALLEQLGFGAPSSPTPSASAPASIPGPLSSEFPPHARAPIEAPVAGSRREARELERAAASRSSRSSSASPERRIREVDAALVTDAKPLP